MTSLRIGLVGCGAIGTEIAQAVDRLPLSDVRLVAIVDTDHFKAEALRAALRRKPKVVGLEAIVQMADLVVEAANRRVVPDLVTKAIHQGKDVMLMSTGGLVDRLDLIDLARRRNCCIYLPSGAITGLDGLKAAMMEKVRAVSLVTTKPPAALAQAPYITRHRIRLSGLKRPTTVFRGSARGAIRGFPANVNVCVSVALAGIGLDRTKVEVRADPTARTNRHELTVIGSFGRLVTLSESRPSPLNPRTSFLAALSAVATLRRIIDPFKVGT